MRLSASSFAGTARTLVAVGSSSEACMFFAIAFAAPRSGLTVSADSASSEDFAGVVEPAAGFSFASSFAGAFCAAGSAFFSAGFAGAWACPPPFEEADEPDVPDDGAEPLDDAAVFAAPPVPDPLEPLRSPRLAPEAAEPDAEPLPDAPVEEVELAPATLDPSSGA
ncbi:hypothetical protein GCM10023201_39840 [Actinomycetospora corticicola]